MKWFIEFFRKRIYSFQCAFVGLRDIFSTEQSAWIHAVCSMIAIVLSVWLRISSFEFVLIVIVITLVWIAEAFNTVFETVIDIVSPQYSKAAKRAKDIAAAAVLFASLGALTVGICIWGKAIFYKPY